MRLPRVPILAFKDIGTGPRIEVIRFQPGHSAIAMSLHGHGFYELIYVESGTGQHTIAGRNHTIGPGSLFAIAPGEPHNPSQMKRCHGYIIIFTGDALESGKSDSSVFSQLPGDFLLWVFMRVAGQGDAHIAIPATQRAAFQANIESLANERNARQPGWEFCTRAYLGLLLTHATRIHAEQSATGITVAKQMRPLLGEVFQFIEARYTRPISLVDVANAVSKSPAYLTDQVRRQTGRTVGEWIVERRMVEARRQLIETEVSMQLIAESIGYEDENYFARVFRKHHRISPSAFRARVRLPR